MTDIEKARQLFRDAGLYFPTIPEEFAARLKEQRKWHFATRETKNVTLQHIPLRP
jgi:hypothetical protein